MCLFSTAGCLWSVRTMRSSEPSSSWRTNCLSSDSSRETRTRRTSGRTSRLLTLSSQHRTENLLVGWSWTVKQHEEGEFTCPRHLKHSDRITRHPQQQQMFCFLECLFSFSCRLVVEDAVVYTDVQFDLLHSFVKDCCFCWFKLSKFFGLFFFTPWSSVIHDYAVLMGHGAAWITPVWPLDVSLSGMIGQLIFLIFTSTALLDTFSKCLLYKCLYRPTLCKAINSPKL